MIREIVLDDGGMNLLSSTMLEWLGQQLSVVSSQLSGPLRTDNRQLVILRSGRPNIFAAGADIAEMQRFSSAEAESFARLGQETFDAIERLPCLTVAVIDGDCFGGALDLVLAFDLRFATSRARFSHPVAKLGIVTGFGGTSRWRKVLGPAAARRLFLSNDVLTAEDALAIGLVDAMGEPDLGRLGALDPMVVRTLKELSWHAERLSRPEVMLLAETLGQIYLRPR